MRAPTEMSTPLDGEEEEVSAAAEVKRDEKAVITSTPTPNSTHLQQH